MPSFNTFKAGITRLIIYCANLKRISYQVLQDYSPVDLMVCYFLACILLVASFSLKGDMSSVTLCNCHNEYCSVLN